MLRSAHLADVTEGSHTDEEELTVHEGELCTRDHLPIATVVMLRLPHLADMKLGISITPSVGDKNLA